MQVREISDPRPTFAQSAASWKRTLKTEEYIENELAMDAFAPARYWAVFSGDSMVSSCRAWVRPALLGGGGAATEACIGNVYTPEEFRGKGYANALLKHTTEVLRAECDLVTLWSEIGEKFYAQFGYKSCPDQKLIQIAVDKATQWPKNVTRVTSKGIAEIGRVHTATLEKLLGPREIATSPAPPLYEFWIHQCKCKARVNSLQVPDLWGAASNGSSCVWYYDFFGGALVLLAVIGPDIKPLLTAAHSAAASLGLAKIETYSESLLGAVEGDLCGETQHRKGSISMYISKHKLVYAGKYAWF